MRGVIGVTGASGPLASAVLRRLVAQLPADRDLVALTRDPRRTPRLEQIAHAVRRADFADPKTLADAFAGIETLLMISIEGPDETRVQLHGNAIRAAVAAGVHRVVYTSFFDVDPRSPSAVGHVHRLTEAALKDSGVEWVILRNGPYADNFAKRVAMAARENGVFRMATGDASLPFIGRDDLAEAAAAAGISAKAGTTWRLSGAELVGFAELCALVSTVMGQPVRYEALSDEEHAAELRGQGLPPSLMERRIAYAQAIRQGFMSALTDDFRRLVGRAPTKLAALLPLLDLSPIDH